MDKYSSVQLAQPLTQKKAKTSVKSILRSMEHTQLTPISEEVRHPKRPAGDPAVLHAQALKSEAVATLQRQRDEAFEALDLALASASAAQKSHKEALQEHTSKKIELDHRAQELEAKNRTLSERCVKLSAWADQHRTATHKLQGQLEAAKTDSGTKEELNHALTALANLDAKHTALSTTHAALSTTHAALSTTHATLCVAHEALNATHEALKKTHSQLKKSQDTTDLKVQLSKTQALLQEAEARANKAERATMSLACAKKLACSAPMSRELLEKAANVLGSSSDVLRHVHGRSESSPKLKAGMDQVCDALSALEADLKGHNIEVGAWLAKRAAAFP